MSFFTIIGWFSLGLAFISALVIAIDEVRHPQKMWIMNVVWPLTALYFSVVTIWVYFRVGRRMAQHADKGLSPEQMKEQKERRKEQSHRDPMWQQTAVADTHCGAGCVLGDVIAEYSIFGLGLVLLGHSIYAEYVGDLVLAWLFGIIFQYFAIKPMRNLSPGQALVAAIKSDTLAILAFEIGLFTWMGITYFILFPHPHLTPNQPTYWFMMQIGMVLGFITSYPMNRWLLRKRWKEVMG